MTPLRIVCDTNVLVSATLSDGPPSRVLRSVARGQAELIVPEVVRRELVWVLADKLRFDAERVRATLAKVDALAVERQTVADVPQVTGQRVDEEVLACSVAAGVDVLVTGDRQHLIPPREHQGVRSRTPQAFLAELAAG